MSLEAQARPGSLAWSNPVTRWWGFLTLVSGANIAVWFLLYRQLHEQPAGSGARQHVLRHRAHAAAQRGLCFRLRLQVVPATRGRSADLPVRHLAVERRRRPLGGNRGRNRLRGAVGDHPAPVGHDDGRRDRLDRRLGDRAVDPDRGMLLMVCGADHPLSVQRASKIRYGPLPSSSSGSAFAGCCRSSMVWFAWPSPSRLSGSSVTWRFS